MISNIILHFTILLIDILDLLNLSEIKIKFTLLMSGIIQAFILVHTMTELKVFIW